MYVCVQRRECCDWWIAVASINLCLALLKHLKTGRVSWNAVFASVFCVYALAYFTVSLWIMNHDVVAYYMFQALIYLWQNVRLWSFTVVVRYGNLIHNHLNCVFYLFLAYSATKKYLSHCRKSSRKVSSYQFTRWSSSSVIQQDSDWKHHTKSTPEKLKITKHNEGFGVAKSKSWLKPN